ncbi:flagellar hook-associated protein FlgK [Glacieibacterium megasporae]|uniref:flagellar hook-associated protein FlgK n=1 Tax=Glacieibacterium megasporae TaxID=2835787 RepID=UPI001C1E5A4D|nr:flagellar hook-associated protein FlgK [Polymorphobacter megasporae]UAJ08677.1 flagellar hook-associated protein FlgK [Polymorphobacter megasporae]
MSDLLSIGASGIAAYQTALSVVGDNVANADTPGYVRRTIVMKTAAAGGAGAPAMRDVGGGNGVTVGDIGRASDALKTGAARDADSDLSRITTRADWLTRLQSALGSGTASLTKRIGGFFDAAQDLSSTPASTAARTIFLDRADQTAAAFRSTASALGAIASDIGAATATQVAQVNQLTTSLAQINAAVTRSGRTGEAGAALLDQRDAALASLATFVRIGVTDTGRGTVEVRLGDGANAPLLVSGTTATAIGVSAAGDVVLHPAHDPVVVRLPASGSLAGLVEAGRKVAATITAVDALATRFATVANAQNMAGVDAAGINGTALFATTTLDVVPGRANGGAAAIDVAVGDAATIAPSGYVLGFDGTAWTLARGDGSGTVTGTGALHLDGITVTPAGTANAGDSFVLAATGGAAGIALRPLDPSQVAAASRWLTDADGANSGSGALAVSVNPAAAGLPALPAYRIVVTGAATADIVDPATSTVIGTAVIDGSSIAGAGFLFTIGGQPAVGDSFRITRNTDGAGDNSNIRALVAQRLAGGTGNTIEASLDATVTGVASTLSETKALATSATAVRDDAQRASDAVGGVDIDTEAAELTRLQAAYKANAQVIATARALFDTLLQAVQA